MSFFSSFFLEKKKKKKLSPDSLFLSLSLSLSLSLTKETPDPPETGARVATRKAESDVSSAAHDAANRAARATPPGEKPCRRTIAWTVSFLKRRPLSTAAPREAARHPVPSPMAAVAASLKRVWGLILRVCVCVRGGGRERKCFFLQVSTTASDPLLYIFFILLFFSPLSSRPAYPKNGFPRSLSSALVSPPEPTTTSAAAGEPPPSPAEACAPAPAPAPPAAPAEAAETAAAEAEKSRLSTGSKAARLPGSSDDLRSSKAAL